jgi:hypothetical protein
MLPGRARMNLPAPKLTRADLTEWKRRSRDRAIPLSPEDCELQPKSGILDRNGLVTAQQ